MFNRQEYQKIISEIPSSVKILAATKTKSVEEIIDSINAGIKIIGENYVKEAEEKYGRLTSLFKERNISFHLIGHLQSNKLKKAIEIFDCIETLDSVNLAEKINQACQKANKKKDVMIEINFDEPNKSGIKISELNFLISKIKFLNNINLAGFMCIPPIGREEECFEKMKELKKKYNVKELSMGMSPDYKTAIKFGATIIRLGTILFGGR